MDIEKFLNKLSKYTYIDFTGKESEMGLLAQKYDKNHNSVFEKEELNSIKDDLSIFIKTDRNPRKMSDNEMSYFYQSLLPNNNKTQISGNLDNMVSMAENLLFQLNAIGEQNKKNIIQKYLDSTDKKRKFSQDDIDKLLELDNDTLERAGKYLFYCDGRKKQLSAHNICSLASRYSEVQLEKIKKLLYVGNREEQFGEYDFYTIAELNDEQYEWLTDNFDKLDKFSTLSILELTAISSKELSTYLAKHPKSIISKFCDNGIEFANVDDVMVNFYFFDKSGLVEQKIVKMSDINANTKWAGKITDLSMTTIYNKRLNLKQKIIKGHIKNSESEETVLKEELFYLDKEGKIIKTVITERNINNGTISVSETDKNGNQHPIQWQSVDANTGANITERHLTSPDGTKTDYYAEESDNLRITDYKITDKDRNALINVHQTFEQISDNKFISSINATGKDEDTRIYEIEYTNDNRVKIYDKKNDKTTLINLNNYFKNKKSAKKLMPYIKKLPGQILLEFAEKPLKFIYDSNNIGNGFWDLTSQILGIGNFDNKNVNDELIAVITHELGHYLDIYSGKISKFADNQEVKKIYEEELKQFQKSTTLGQQEYIDYFTSDMKLFFNSDREKVAETHSILYSTDCTTLNMRRLYFAQYFPRTMAAIMKLLLEEEGVKV